MSTGEYASSRPLTLTPLAGEEQGHGSRFEHAGPLPRVWVRVTDRFPRRAPGGPGSGTGGTEIPMSAASGRVFPFGTTSPC